jgi:hypothetical protein
MLVNHKMLDSAAQQFPRQRGSFRPSRDYLINSARFMPNPKAKLLDQVREVLRVKHSALRTEEVHIHSIKRHIFLHQTRRPNPRFLHAPAQIKVL